jgi:hypothetical protein
MQHEQRQPPLLADFNSFVHGALGYFIQHCGSFGVSGKETGSKKGAARVEVGGDARKVLTFDFTPVSKSVVRIFNVNYSVCVGFEESQKRWVYKNYTSNRRHFGLYNVKLDILFKEISVVYRDAAVDAPPLSSSGEGEGSCDLMSCLRNFFVSLPRVTSSIQKRSFGGDGCSGDGEE